jgi:hypothetical protein
MTNPMTKVWEWILSNRLSDDEDTANLAFFLDRVVQLGPLTVLAVLGGQMASHGVPTWLAVVVPLVLAVVCHVFLTQLPANRAQHSLQHRPKKPESISARTARLRQALLDADHISRQLQSQLRVGTESLKRVEQQAADYKELVNLNEAAAQAVKRAMASETVPEIQRGSRSSLRWALFGVVAGVVATVLVGLFAKSIAL